MQKKWNFFMAVMLSRCQGGGLHHLWSKSTKSTQHTTTPWQSQLHPRARRRPSPPKKNVSITPFFIFLRSWCDCATVESTVWLPSCSFFTIDVVVATRKPLTSSWPYFLFRIHQKRLPLSPNDICWIYKKLTNIGQFNKSFGGFTIIFIGDFRQMGPVCSKETDLMF